MLRTGAGISGYTRTAATAGLFMELSEFLAASGAGGLHHDRSLAVEVAVEFEIIETKTGLPFAGTSFVVASCASTVSV